MGGDYAEEVDKRGLASADADITAAPRVHTRTHTTFNKITNKSHAFTSTCDLEHCNVEMQQQAAAVTSLKDLEGVAVVLVEDSMARLLVVAAFQLAHRELHAVPWHDVTVYGGGKRGVTVYGGGKRGVRARSRARFGGAVEQAAVCAEFPGEELLAGGKASVVLAW
jgi:hypothetical protein